MTGSSNDARLLAAYANGKVLGLQRAYLGEGGDQGHARATLARLRRTELTGAAAWLTVGEEVFLDMPPVGGGEAGQARADRLVLDVLGLYAVHQQGRHDRMACAPTEPRGTGTFGYAARQLASLSPRSEPGIVRRLSTIEAAPDYGNRLDGIRALVRMMRTEGVPLDYRRLAEDLYWLQRDSCEPVYERWSHDFYARPAVGASEAPTAKSGTTAA